jgi:N-methylhydantoinase A
LLDDAAEPLGLDLASAAAGVVAIAEASMGHAVHAVTVERGRDPRDFVLLSYGGAGGLFAAAVAEGLEVPRVVIPRAPSTFSAWGILSSDYREDASLTRVRPLEPASVAGIRGDLSSLDRHVSGTLAAHGFDPADIVLAHRVDLRFAGQEHTVSVLVDLDPDRSGGDDEAFVAVCRERFVALHRRLFGHGDPSTPAEVVTARAQGVGMVQRPRWTPWEVRMPGRARTVRRVHFSSEGFVDTPVYDREVLAVDQTIVGPVVVEEWSTTIVVPPGWSAVVDRLGDLVMEAV